MWPCNKEFYFFQKLFKFFVLNIVSVINAFDFQLFNVTIAIFLFT